MLSEDLSAQLLLPFVDVGIKLVSVLSNGELFVIVNWNKYLFSANTFIFSVMELDEVGMF